MSQTLDGFEGRLLTQALNSIESINREVVSKVLMARKYSRQLILHGMQQHRPNISVTMPELRSLQARICFFNPNNTQRVEAMLNNKIRLLSAVLFASLLTGCLVPGSNINPNDYDTEGSWFESNQGSWFPSFRRDSEPAMDEAALHQMVDIVAITPSVIANQVDPSARVPAPMPASLMQELQSYEYYIDKGDILQITVYDHPELTNPSGSNNSNVESSGITVENDGTIYYPYIGKVQVAGRTVDQVRDAIAQPLGEFIATPQISVRVARFNAKRAYVTGQVNEPGPQPITNVPVTVLDAISRAGGLSEQANWHEVLLSRNGQEVRLSVYDMLHHGRLGQNMLLEHGDVLHVPNLGQQQVFVLGELNRVNTLPMGNIRMSLTEALTRSGGLNQVTSNAEGIFVIRQMPEDSGKLATVYQLNVRNAIAFAVGTRFVLEPSDIVYVTTAPVTRWNRVISQILPSMNALLTADRVGSL